MQLSALKFEICATNYTEISVPKEIKVVVLKTKKQQSISPSPHHLIILCLVIPASFLLIPSKGVHKKNGIFGLAILNLKNISIFPNLNISTGIQEKLDIAKSTQIWGSERQLF